MSLVPGQELELSPRHEQAKQLLQRARMKARTNPLRASHDILLLPAAAPRPRSVPPACPRGVPRAAAGFGTRPERAHVCRHACGAGTDPLRARCSRGPWVQGHPLPGLFAAKCLGGV